MQGIFRVRAQLCRPLVRKMAWKIMDRTLCSYLTFRRGCTFLDWYDLELSDSALEVPLCLAISVRAISDSTSRSKEHAADTSTRFCVPVWSDKFRLMALLSGASDCRKTVIVSQSLTDRHFQAIKFGKGGVEVKNNRRPSGLSAIYYHLNDTVRSVRRSRL